MITKFEVSNLKKLVEKACGSWLVKIVIDEVAIHEGIKKKETRVACRLNLSGRTEKIIDVNCVGSGVVDALFCCLMDQFSEKYPSLLGLTLKEFSIEAKKKRNYHNLTTSDPAVSVLVVSNSFGKELEFRQDCHSINSSAICCIKDMIEFFINAEVAVKRLVVAIKDAKSRNRSDLTDRYMRELSELMKITSYENTIGKH